MNKKPKISPVRLSVRQTDIFSLIVIFNTELPIQKKNQNTQRGTNEERYNKTEFNINSHTVYE